MVIFRESEPRADHRAGERPRQVSRQVGPAEVGEPVDQAPRLEADCGLEPCPDLGRAERHAEGLSQAGVVGRIDAGEVPRGLEQLIPVVVIVALAARERLPVSRRGLDIIEPGEGPDPSLLVPV